MRASDLYGHLVAQVRATPRDSRGGSSDTWYELKTSSDPVVTPDGSFRLSLESQPQRANDDQVSAYIVSFNLTTFHQGAAPEVIDRIADEAERLQESLTAAALIVRDSDFMHVELSPRGVTEHGQLLASRFQLTVLYRQTASVLG